MIASIPADRWRVISASAQEYARARFDINAVCREYLTLYTGLVSKRGMEMYL